MEKEDTFRGYSPDYEGYNSEEQEGNKEKQANLIPQGGFPNPAAMKMMKIYMMISLFSWVGLIITGWLFLIVPDIEKIKIFWTYIIITKDSLTKEAFKFPLNIYFVLFLIIAIITLISITAAFGVYVYSIFIKKDFKFIGAVLMTSTKFHFIPLLTISALFIIGESVDKDKGFEDEHYISSLIFTIISLVLLIFFYIKTNLDSSLYANWTIKSGAFSCLIALLMHNIGYVISIYSFNKIWEKKKFDKQKDYWDWLKYCYIIFSIVVGLGNLIVSFVLKEMVIAFINFLIYIGMTVSFYKLVKESRKEIYGKAPGIIDIVMICCSACLAAFLFLKKMKIF